MEASRFDRLVKALTSVDSRRGLLRVLAALPLSNALAELLAEEGDAHDRHHHRQTRDHDHDPRTSHDPPHQDTRNGQGTSQLTGQRKRRCKPKSVAKTCQGKCGQVLNNCKKPVDCGDCTCEPSCASGCCQNGACQAGTSDGACGRGGQPCTPCSGVNTCGGGGTPGVCGSCTPDPDETTCAGACGNVTNNCGQSVGCTALCQGCCNGTTCVAYADQTDTMCARGGNACESCGSNFFCDGDGNCGCIGVSGQCNPSADQCCPDFHSVCSNSGTCCVMNGFFCSLTFNPNCAGTGCCCSGNCVNNACQATP